MFKRIVYDNWTQMVPIISFWLTFGVFLAITLRALFYKKDYIRHMGNLPLDESPRETNSKK